MPETVSATLTRDGQTVPGGVSGLIYRSSSRAGAPSQRLDNGPVTAGEAAVFSVAAGVVVREGDLVQVPPCGFTGGKVRQFLVILVRNYGERGSQCDLVRFETVEGIVIRFTNDDQTASEERSRYQGILRPVSAASESESANRVMSVSAYEWVMLPYPASLLQASRIVPTDTLTVDSMVFEVVGNDRHPSGLLLVFRLARLS